MEGGGEGAHTCTHPCDKAVKCAAPVGEKKEHVVLRRQREERDSCKDKTHKQQGDTVRGEAANSNQTNRQHDQLQNSVTSVDGLQQPAAEGKQQKEARGKSAEVCRNKEILLKRVLLVFTIRASKTKLLSSTFYS